MVSVTVKMSENQIRQLTTAAAKLWPKAILSRSSIVLSLALMGAERAGKKKS